MPVLATYRLYGACVSGAMPRICCAVLHTGLCNACTSCTVPHSGYTEPCISHAIPCTSCAVPHPAYTEACIRCAMLRVSCTVSPTGYWQLRVGCQRLSLFDFRVMPFGLTIAPAVFQHLTQKVLAGLNPAIRCGMPCISCVVPCTGHTELSVSRTCHNIGCATPWLYGAPWNAMY